MRYDDKEKDAEFLAKVREIDRECSGDGEDPHFWEKALYGGLDAQKETFAVYCKAVSNWGLRKELLKEPLSTVVPTELLPLDVLRQCRERGEVVYFWLNLVPAGDPLFKDDSSFDRAAYGDIRGADGESRPIAEPEMRWILWHAAQLSDGEHLNRCSEEFKAFLAGYWRERWPCYDGRPLSLAVVDDWQDCMSSAWMRLPNFMRFCAFFGIDLVRLSRWFERLRMRFALWRSGL